MHQINLKNTRNKKLVMSLVIIDNQLNQKQFKEYQEEFLFFHYCQLKRIEEEGKRQSLAENIKLYFQSCFQIIINLLQSINDGYSYQEIHQLWEKNKQQQLVQNDKKTHSLTQHQLQSVVTTNSSNQSESSPIEENQQQSQFPNKDEEVVKYHKSNQPSQDFNNDDHLKKQLKSSTIEDNQKQSKFPNKDQVVININLLNQQPQNNDNNDNHKQLDKQLDSFTQVEIQQKSQVNKTDERFDKKNLSRLHQNSNHDSTQLKNSTLEKNQEQSYFFNDDQTVIQKNQSSRQTQDYNNDDLQSNQQLISNQKQISQQTSQLRQEQNQRVNDQQSSFVKNQINNNDYQSQKQQEIQTQKSISSQALQQIQYYVYEDLNNLMEVLADVKQTLLHFKNQTNHPYIPLSQNRLIQQVNLSNMIHFDCTKRYKNKDEEYFYKKEKENAQQLYYQLLDEIQLSENLTDKNQPFHVYLRKYEQNFGQVNSINQLDLLQIPEQGEFNQKVIQQVFEGIQHVDNKQSEIKKGKYMKIGYDQIKNNIKQRELRAQQLLKKNFPNQNQTIQEQD